MSMIDFNPLAEAMDEWYTASFSERLYKTYVVFSGIHFFRFDRHLESPITKQVGILDLLLFPIFSAALFYGIGKAFQLFNHSFDLNISVWKQCLLIPTLIVLYPISAMFLVVSIPLAIALELARQTLAIMLTLALSPLVALVHGFVHFKTKSMRNDIKNLVLFKGDPEQFLTDHFNVKPEDKKIHDNQGHVFGTKSLFLDCIPGLNRPPNSMVSYSLKIFETKDELLFNFNFAFSIGFNISGKQSKSYLLNEQNSKGFAALLKTDDKFVRHLRDFGLLDKVTQMIKNPYDKSAREMIEQSIKISPLSVLHSDKSKENTDVGVDEKKEWPSQSVVKNPSIGFFNQPVNSQSAVSREAPLQKTPMPTDVLKIIYEYAGIGKS